ncbi:hypothetical protein GNI_165420 [Gregarina niphandrodes]|uniref:Uncharacterized protein n=1 Tax=Gregarina niphandrodes TaxID=110365 RepID=A0A023AY58_GRENI|nr:hypothetical protein GNI_165420 [Gregarina niphandrodes]EZG43592.1 hypothetical protein GNI_165420 [Gregarina niphandrodes]|eukprot:XP_011133184.1 hypothetical protein GNI_165420 [Gregarina niphandrodes]
MSLKVLAQSVNFSELLNGCNTEYGKELLALFRDLQNPWPRGKKLKFDASFASLLRPARLSRPSIENLSLNISEQLIVWTLIHTESQYVRLCILRWCVIVASARLACRHLNGAEVFGRVIRDNLCVVRKIVRGSGAFGCLCAHEDTPSDTAPGARELWGKTRAGDEDEGELLKTDPEYGRQPEGGGVKIEPRTKAGTKAETKGIIRLSPPGRLRFEVCPWEVELSSRAMSTATSTLCEEDQMTVGTITGRERLIPRWVEASTVSEPAPVAMSPEEMLRVLELQMAELNINFCDHLYASVQRSVGWSITTLPLFYEAAAVWHELAAPVPGRVSRVLLCAHTRAVRACSADAAHGSTREASRARVLRRTAALLRRAAPQLDRETALAPAERFRELWQPGRRVTLRDALATERQPRARAASDGTSLDAFTVCASEAAALVRELRLALTNLVGGASLFLQAWVDVTAVDTVEAVDTTLSEDLVWLRQRWQALPEIIEIFTHIDHIHGCTKLAAHVNQTVNSEPNSDRCYHWLVSVLSILAQDSGTEKKTERIKGMAAVISGTTDLQQNRSIYWLNIHPLVKHVIEPNRADWRQVPSIPFVIDSQHLAVYHQIMTSLVMEYDVGPPEFCEAYVTCVLNSSLNTKQVLDKMQVYRSRLFMLWEEFKEYTFFHESCRLTPQMLQFRAPYFVREFLDMCPEDFLTRPIDQLQDQLQPQDQPQDTASRELFYKGITHIVRNKAFSQELYKRLFRSDLMTSHPPRRSLAPAPTKTR